MTPEQTRRLNRLIWQQRLKIWLPIVAAFIVVLSAGVYLTTERASHLDRTVEVHTVGGEVLGASRMFGRRGGFLVKVKLDDGSEIQATSSLPLPPHKGGHVELKSASHQSGRVTYDVIKMTN